jgi:hypothetical protein
MEGLQPVSALLRRVYSAPASEKLLAAWERLSNAWRLACAVAAGLLLLAAAALGFVLFSSSDWGGKLAGIAAAVAVLYAGYQVRLTRAIAKQTLAYQYFERFSGYSLEDPYAVAKAFSFDRPDTETAAERRWEEFQRWEGQDPTKVRDILFIFNFFEELGGIYRRGAVDRQVINEYLGKFAQQFWDQLDWFVSRIRDHREQPTLFEDWGEMAHAVKRARNRREELRKRLPQRP